jgi:hypothetical protein
VPPPLVKVIARVVVVVTGGAAAAIGAPKDTAKSAVMATQQCIEFFKLTGTSVFALMGETAHEDTRW